MKIRRSREFFLVGLVALVCGAVPWARADGPALAEIRVGIDAGDIRGSDNQALQAAVDRIANLGGGIVHIGPGRYTMRNALFLRDHVHVKGTPGATVLMACDGIESPLACDGDCNERQVTLKKPAGFQIGDGISVQDDAFRRRLHCHDRDTHGPVERQRFHHHDAVISRLYGRPARNGPHRLPDRRWLEDP